MKLILLGAPGAGKGTIAGLLSAQSGAVQISTGDILRGAVEAGNELGRRAQAFMSRGAPKVAGMCDNCGRAIVQRDDETAEAIAHRLATYAEKTAPLIDYYAERGLLLTTRSTNADEIVAAIVTRLAEG